VWCTVDVSGAILPELRAALFQPRSEEIRVETSPGAPILYRFESNAAKTGFIVSPFLKDLTSIGESLCGVDVSPPRWLAIEPQEGVDWATVRFYSMSARRQSAAPPLCATTAFPMLGITPRAIDASHGAVEVDGKTRMLAHAPGKLTLDVPNGARSIRGEYGFMRGAYEGGGATDGVVFRLLSDGGSSGSQVLWEKWLRPLTNPQDRGILSFRVAIPDDVRRLVLQTDAGPSGNNSWDWSVWSGVIFESERAPGEARTGH
jgi:hypothetical protein